MSTEMLIKMGFSILLFYGNVVLAYALFKFPLKTKIKEISTIAVSLGLINFYTQTILEIPSYPLINILSYIVLILIVNRYPLLYSMVFGILAYAISGLIDTLVTITAIRTAIENLEELKRNTTHLILAQSIVIIIHLLIAYILRRYQFGLSLMISKFSTQYSISKVNYIWALLFILTVGVIQIGSGNFEIMGHHYYIIGGMIVALLLLLWYSYVQNKKHLEARQRRRKD